MSEDTFRWVITAGVGLSWLMTAIMAGAMLGVYRASKRLEEKVTPLLEKANGVLDQARSILNDAGPRIRDVIEKTQEMTALAREQVGKLDALVTETADRARLQFDRIEIWDASRWQQEKVRGNQGLAAGMDG